MTARWIQTGSSTIEVMNKADLMGGVGPVATRLRSVAIAAQTSEGLPELLAAIESRLSEGMVTVGRNGHRRLRHPSSNGAQLAWLYEDGEVVGRNDGDEAIHVTVRLLPQDHARFEQQAPSRNG